jgi:hypothetical protein
LFGSIFVRGGEKDVGGLGEEIGDPVGGAVGLGLVIHDASAETSDMKSERADWVFLPLGGRLGLFIFHVVVRN